MTKTDKIILGIDPGTQFCGYGLLHVKGKELSVITLGYFDLRKYADTYLKLQKIYERVEQLVAHYKPDEFAIEAPFYGKNVQSMLKLGRAQGVAMAAALSRAVPIFEYSPRKIKQAITGNGNASKEQVAAFLKSILKLDEVPQQLDASDGLAVALCHQLQNKIIPGTKNYSSWNDFISKNPNRIKS